MPPKFTLPERPDIRRAAKPAAFIVSPLPIIDIYGEIGPYEGGISAKAVLDRLREAQGDTLNIRLNSGGGDIYDGIAIYNDLVAHSARVCVTITGIAASAASLICMAADEIAMAPGSRMMLHNSWCWGEGNASYFEALVKELRAIDASMAGFYAARTGKSQADIAAMMDSETWLDAKDAVEAGFADRMEGNVKTLAPPAAKAPARPAAQTFVPRPKPPLSLNTVEQLEKLADTLERTGQHAHS